MYVDPRKRAYLVQKQRKEQVFIRNHPEIYQKYRDRGFSHDKAVKYAEKEIFGTKKAVDKNLRKIKDRFELNINRPGILAFSIEDIRRTKTVDDWINTMVDKGTIIDMGYKIKFPRNEGLRRY